MNRYEKAFFCVSVACVLAACSSSSDDGGSSDGGPSGGDGSGTSSGYAALCHDECAAVQPKIPSACASGFASKCESSCDGALASEPESCRSAVQAYFDCLSTKATYQCAGGALSDDHTTSCSAQYAAFKSCH
jgi:hypothetical protein